MWQADSPTPSLSCRGRGRDSTRALGPAAGHWQIVQVEPFLPPLPVRSLRTRALLYSGQVGLLECRQGVRSGVWRFRPVGPSGCVGRGARWGGFVLLGRCLARWSRDQPGPIGRSAGPSGFHRRWNIGQSLPMRRGMGRWGTIPARAVNTLWGVCRSRRCGYPHVYRRPSLAPPLFSPPGQDAEGYRRGAGRRLSA